MNKEAYIASGQLELYVLGELTPAEAAEVEAMAERYPEVRQEILGIEAALEVMATQNGVAPRAGLREEIIQTITASGNARGETASTQAARSKGKAKTISLLRYGIAASLAAALIATVFAFYFRGQWKDTEQRLSSVLTQNQQIANQYKAVQQEAQQLSQENAIITNPDFRAVAMPGVEASPGSLAYVYWNQGSDQVYLKVNTLPANSTDKQYQLWAIVDGKPVSAGVFDVDGNAPQRLVQMQDIENASAFAVTLEPQGGSASPTLEAMVVQGAVENT